MTRSHRVGLLARRRLVRLATRDSVAILSGSGPNGGSFENDSRFENTPSEISTPTVHAIQAAANAYARREEQRLFAKIGRELTEHRLLTQTIDADVASYQDVARTIPSEDLDIIEGTGPSVEQLRRLARRISRDQRRAEELSAVVHSRFNAAKLRASLYYDYSDDRIAIYWAAFRTAAPADPRGHRARPLRRVDWLAITENSRLLELLQGRTDVKA